MDDHFDEHPKIASLSDSAFSLWVSSLAYSNRNLTDGFIPSLVGLGKLRFCGGNTVPTIRELEAAGLWEPCEGGWRIHDYLDFQPSKQEVLEERAKKQAAGQAGGIASAKARAQAKWQAESKPVPVPVPLSSSTSLSASETEETTSETATVVPATRSRFAPPTLDQVRRYCLERQNGVDPQVWIDHYTSNGWKVGRNPMKDWMAAVRTWERNGIQGPAGGATSFQQGKGGALMELGQAMKRLEDEQS